MKLIVNAVAQLHFAAKTFLHVHGRLRERVQQDFSLRTHILQNAWLALQHVMGALYDISWLLRWSLAHQVIFLQRLSFPPYLEHFLDVSGQVLVINLLQSDQSSVRWRGHLESDLSHDTNKTQTTVQHLVVRLPPLDHTDSTSTIHDLHCKDSVCLQPQRGWTQVPKTSVYCSLPASRKRICFSNFEDQAGTAPGRTAVATAA